MATNKDVDASAAPTETPAAQTVETPTRPRRGLALAGIIGGGVVAAGLLFGGGVLLGSTLPGLEHRMEFAQGEAPGLPPMQQGAPQQGGPQQNGPQQNGPGHPQGGDDRERGDRP